MYWAKVIKKQNSQNKYNSLKFKNIFMILGCFWVIVTIYVCLMPNPPSTSGIEFGDKLMHMSGYICLFIWFSQIYSRQNHWRPAVSLILLGIMIEIVQGTTEYRSFEVADMVANTAGVLLGWLLARTRISQVFVRFESMTLKT